MDLEELQILGFEKVYFERALRLRLTPNIWVFKVKKEWEFVPDPSFLEKRYQGLIVDFKQNNTV